MHEYTIKLQQSMNYTWRFLILDRDYESLYRSTYDFTDEVKANDAASNWIEKNRCWSDERVRS